MFLVLNMIWASSTRITILRVNKLASICEISPRGLFGFVCFSENGLKRNLEPSEKSFLFGMDDEGTGIFGATEKSNK